MLPLARTLALLLSLSFVACGGGTSAAESAAVGPWTLNSEATLKANEAVKAAALADVPEGMRDAADKMFNDMFTKMDLSITIAEDGTLTGIAKMPNPMTGQMTEKKTTGTWSAEGDTVTMATKDSDTGNEETMVATLSGDTLTAEIADGDNPPMTLVLARK